MTVAIQAHSQLPKVAVILIPFYSSLIMYSTMVNFFRSQGGH